MFQFKDGSQFVAVALKLNRHAHLLARISATDISCAAAHTTSRWRRPDFIDDAFSLLAEIEPPRPFLQLLLIEHEDFLAFKYTTVFSRELDGTGVNVGDEIVSEIIERANARLIAEDLTQVRNQHGRDCR